jgi:hypothetical protein
MVPQTIRLTPTDDVWVYSHASDPAHDEFLRVWGAEGKAIPASADEAEELSMGYLKWDLSSVPAGKKLTKATLVVMNIANPGYTFDQAKAAPLEARSLPTEFDEKTWEPEKLAKTLPSKEAFGSGYPAVVEKDKPLEIDIDLLKGPKDFQSAFAGAMLGSAKQIGMALTSAIDIAAIGRTGMYKLYSRDTKLDELKPQLVLVFE